MGSVAWKGDELYSGFEIRIGDKDIELDRRVDSSQLPNSVDALRLVGIDNNTSRLSCSEPQPSGDMTPQHDMLLMSPSANFVAPASFYGVGKPKIKGPL